MRVIQVICVLILTLLSSCKVSKHSVKQTDVKSHISVTDSLSVKTDSVKHSWLLTDTTRVIASDSTLVVIDFEQGGGVVSIDSIGRISISRVKAIKSHRKATQVTNRGVNLSAQTDSVASVKSERVKMDEAVTVKASEMTDTKSESLTGWLEIIGAIVLVIMLIYIFAKPR